MAPRAFASTVMAAGALTGLALALWARRDYQAWRALGPGGLPANLRGWTRTSLWRLKKRNPFSDEGFASAVGGPQDRVALGEIPVRPAPRPKIAPWPIPHRQLDQFPPPDMGTRVHAVFDRAVQNLQAGLHYQLSYFEKRHRAIFLREPATGHSHAQCSHGEVAHIHGDFSMHMILSPSDCKTAMAKGWGELHPLCGVHPELPPTYLYVYPPRDEGELVVVSQLLDASIAHMMKNA